MSARSAILAMLAGAGAYAILRANKAQHGGDGPQIIYVQQPAPQTSRGSGLERVLPFLSLGLSLLDSNGNRAFGSSGRGYGDTVSGVTIPATSGGGGEQSLLDMIARYEGGVNGYDVVYGGSKIRPPRPITQMTVQQVRNWQDQSVRAGSASSAVGKYQIIRSTMDSLINQGVLRRSELFNAAAQERAGRALLDRRGYSDYRSGRISETTFAQRLSQEWASLPAVTTDKNGRTAQGQSYYAGDGLNAAHYSIDQLMAAVRGLS